MSQPKEGELTGWLWKRAPRTTDTDKNYLRRMILSGSRYRRRYFVLSHSDKSLRYFSDNTDRGSELGAIDLRDIIEASTEPPAKEEKAPTQFAINIRTGARVWSLCADNEDARLEWLFELKRYLPSAPPREGLVRRLSSSRSGLGWLRGKAQSVGSDEAPEINLLGDLATQHARWEAVQSVWQRVTGNVPATCTSYWSERDPATLQFVQQFADWCNHFDPVSYVTDTLLNQCAFLTPKRGAVLCREGEAAGCVYLILEGSVSRTMQLCGSDVSLPQLEAGEFFCDVDVISTGIALCTAVSGHQTVLLSLPVFVLDGLLEDPCYCFLRERLAHDRTQALLAQIFQQLPLFQGLESASTLVSIASLFSIRRARPGDVLSAQNAPPDEFIIILHGSANLVKHAEGGEEVPMGIVRAGDWFADLGLMRQHPCTASLVATVPTTYLHTNESGFQKLLEIGGEQLRSAVEHTIPAQMTRMFANIPLFAGLDDQFMTVSAKSTLVQQAAGDRLCVQGSFSESLYIIVSGCCKAHLEFVGDISLVQASNHNSGVPIRTLKENDFFGEETLLQRTQRLEWTVVAETQCVLLKISARDFPDIVSVCPVLGQRLQSMRSQGPKFDHIPLLAERIRAALDLQSSDELRQENVALRAKIELLEQRCARLIALGSSRRQSYQPRLTQSSDNSGAVAEHDSATAAVVCLNES